jgi:hypothetical protein
MHLFGENVHFQSIEFSDFFVIEWSKCFLKDKIKKKWWVTVQIKKIQVKLYEYDIKI